MWGPRQIIFTEPHLYKQSEWNVKKKSQIRNSTKVVAKSWVGAGENRERLGKVYQLLTVRWIRSEGLRCNMVTIVDNTVLCN